jgi:hypothetical protein
MALRHPRLRPGSSRLLPHEARAADNLAFIRSTLERAGPFTAVSGWAQVAVGSIGLATAAVAGRIVDPDAWIATWVSAAALGVVISAVGMSRKAARLGVPLLSRPARRFALTFTTPLAAGAILTVVLYRAGLLQQLPGTWLLLFGTGVVTGGAMSVGVVPLMGVCFMVVGVAAFLLPAAWGDLMMAAGFGLLNIVFGLTIAVRHGG